MATVSEKYNSGIIDKTGSAVIPILYDFAKAESEDLIYVLESSKQGYIDKTQKEIIPIKYDDTKYIKEVGIIAKLDDSIFLFDKHGQLLKRFD